MPKRTLPIRLKRHQKRRKGKHVRIMVCICRRMHRHPYITTYPELTLNHELEQPSPRTSHSDTATFIYYNKQLPKSTTIRLARGDSYRFTCFSNITDITLNYRFRTLLPTLVISVISFTSETFTLTCFHILSHTNVPMFYID